MVGVESTGLWGPQRLLTPPSLLQRKPRMHLRGPDWDAAAPTSPGRQDAALRSFVTHINDCFLSLLVCLGEGRLWGRGREGPNGLGHIHMH